MKPNFRIAIFLLLFSITVLIPAFTRYFDGHFIFSILVVVFSLAIIQQEELSKYFFTGCMLSFVLAFIIYQFSPIYQDLPFKFFFQALIFSVLIWWVLGFVVGFILFKSFQIKWTKSLGWGILNSIAILLVPLLLRDWIHPQYSIGFCFFLFSILVGIQSKRTRVLQDVLEFMLPFLLYCLVFLLIDFTSFFQLKIMSVFATLLGACLFGIFLGIILNRKFQQQENQPKMGFERNRYFYYGIGMLGVLGILFITPFGSFLKFEINQFFLLEPKLERIENVKIEEEFWNKEVKLYDSQKSINMNQFKGKPVLINYWGTWCAPCVMEMPSFQKLYNKQKEDVHFLFIAVNDTPEKIQKFMEKNQYDFPVYQITDSLSSEMNPKSYPTTYVLNVKGELILKETGSADWNSPEIYELLNGLK